MYYIAKCIGMSPVVFLNMLAPTVVKHLPHIQLLRAIFIVCTVHHKLPLLAVVEDLKCAISLCSRRFHTVKELVSHLNDHIGEGRSVSCPVSGCRHVFTKKSSFTSHRCRKHKSCSPNGIDDMYRETRPTPPDIIARTDDSENTHDAIPTATVSDMPENESQFYLRNMSLLP